MTKSVTARFMLPLLILGMTPMLSLGQEAKESQPEVQSAALGPGDHTRNLKFGEQKRTYLVHIPKGYDPQKPTPVVLSYLLAAQVLPAGESGIFEIGSPDVMTSGDLIREYARQKGLRRLLIFLPVLTPYLSGLWLALVTPASFEVGRHLIEGLRNPTVVLDQKALKVFPIRPMGVREAIRKAIAAATG